MSSGSSAIHVDPIPAKPVGSFDLAAMQWSQKWSALQTVFGMILDADNNLTGSIVSGAPLFTNLRLYASDLVLVDQTPDHSVHPVRVWQRENTVVTTGVQQLTAKKGQLIEVKVGADGPGGTAPGLNAGEAIIRGTSLSVSVPLRVNLIGVDTTSLIGKRWLAMGGTVFFGEVLANVERAPNGNGWIQRFDNGVLYQTAEYYLSQEAWNNQTISAIDSVARTTYVTPSNSLPTRDAVTNTASRHPSSKAAPAGAKFVPSAALKSGLTAAQDRTVYNVPNRAAAVQPGSATTNKPSPALDPGFYASVVYFLSNNVYAKFATLGSLKTWNGHSPWDELQFPIEDTFKTEEAGEASRFQGGVIVIRPDGRAYVVYGAIYTHYASFGDIALKYAPKMPFVGWPISDEEPAGRGRRSRFESGDIYWAPNLGASEVHGWIRSHWSDLGGPDSVLGLPTTDEKGTGDGIGRFNQFENGAIYWTAGTGASEMHGEVLNLWRSLGSETSYLGYPTSDVLPGPLPFNISGANYISYFQYGQILWIESNGAFDQPVYIEPPNQPVLTPSGTALGGTVSIRLASNGDYRFLFEMRDTGVPDYDFDVHALFTTPGGLSLAAAYSGHIEGSSTALEFRAPVNRLTYDFSGNDWRIRQNWPDFQNGALWLVKSYSATGFIGAMEDLGKAILDLGSSAAGLTIGIVIALGSEVLQALSGLGLNWTIGIIAGTVVFLYGGGLVFATVAGLETALVASAVIRQKDFPQDIYDEVSAEVFANSLPPREKLKLTNLTSPGGRPFTLPGYDKNIYINIGDNYDDPWPISTTGEDERKLKPRQLLVHELTHAWQIQHRDLLPLFFCDAIRAQADYDVGQGVYHYGPPDASWDSFTTEGQAQLVEDWYGGNPNVNVPFRKNPCDVKDPYFGYIRDIIWQAR